MSEDIVVTDEEILRAVGVCTAHIEQQAGRMSVPEYTRHLIDALESMGDLRLAHALVFINTVLVDLTAADRKVGKGQVLSDLAFALEAQRGES
ncbi:hypothetical protein [Modestobacter lapidis]|nr:hypothetical protein [Modestobacter lapidis]